MRFARMCSSTTWRASGVLDRVDWNSGCEGVSEAPSGKRGGSVEPSMGVASVD